MLPVKWSQWKMTCTMVCGLFRVIGNFLNCHCVDVDVGISEIDNKCYLCGLTGCCLCLCTSCVQSRMSARGGKKKATKLSRSARAGVIFPVGRMMRYLRTGTHKYRIGMGAPVYMAAVIEYLAGRVWDEIRFIFLINNTRIWTVESINYIFKTQK